MHAPPSRDLVVPLLRLEGLAAFVASILMWAAADGAFLAFVPLLLVPDISAVGYLRSPSLGAVTYNLVHNWAIGLAVLGLGWWFAATPVLMAGIILIGHVGMDRTFGYGLKHPTGFGDTHLGRIGRREPAPATNGR
jgi:hypothetical protein